MPTMGFTSYGESIGTMLSNSASENVKLKDVNWAVSRFPELSYHLGAISNFVAYAGSTPWANRDALGPAGISLVFQEKEKLGLQAGAVLTGAMQKLNEAGGDLETFTQFLKENIRESGGELSDKNKTEISFLRTVCKELVDSNGTLMKVYKMSFSLLMYNVVIQDFSADFSRIDIYSPDEIELENEENSDEINNWREQSKKLQEGKAKYKVIKTGEYLSTRARALQINDGDLNKSTVGKVIHYLRIIDLIETAMSVERVTKSLSFLIWKVGVDGMPGEQVTDYLGAYRGIVMNRLKAGMNDSNAISSEISKSLTSTHIFVPDYKDSPTSVESINLSYRPMMDDLNYWWGKVFMAMGIPPYYNDAEKLQGAAGGVTDFHENVFGANVRSYQSVIEVGLKEWVYKFLMHNVKQELAETYALSLHLPIFVSSGEEARGEYMRRVNQFASAFSTLSVAGMPIKPEFAIKLLFPNTDPEEVIDWKVRELSLGQAAEQGEDGQPGEESYDPAVVDSLIGNMVSGQGQDAENEEDTIPVNEMITPGLTDGS